MKFRLVLTDPDPVTKKLVMVMVVSAQKFTDPTVLLEVGDHPFIRHRSHVEYKTAKPFPLSNLTAALGGGGMSIKEDMTPELLGESQG